MKWQTYPRYKSTGVDVIDQIPEHWSITSNRTLFTDISEKGFPNLPMLSVSQRFGVIPQEYSKDEIIRSSENKDGYKRVEEGDFVYNKMRMWQGAVGVAAQVGIVSPAYVIFRAKVKLVPRFYEYLYRTPRYLAQSGRYSYGLCDDMNSLRAEHFRMINSIYPPVEDQEMITAFLDHKTTHIDTLIAKKERQIELLQEKRAALISHAVTKGLDPDVPMKDSGVEWLGEVPEHWEVKKLKYLIMESLANGLFKKKQHFGSGVKLVNVFDVYRDDFLVDFESLDRVEANESEQDKYAVYDGDIFFVRSSLKLEGVGRSVCAIDVPEPTVFECHVVRARPNQTMINPEFLINLLNSKYAINRFIALSNMVTMATIDQDKIKSLEIPIPPLVEQNEIMDFLKHEIGILAILKERIDKSIATLHEYRTALISAAVTGKIDVRCNALPKCVAPK